MNNKLLSNSFYHSLTFILPTIFLVIFTPYFVHKLGDEGYGIWMLSLSVLGLAGTMELGLGVATAKYVAEYSTNHDEKGLSTVFTLSLILYSGLGVIVGMFIYYFAPNICGWFKVSDSLRPVATSTIRLVSFAVLPSLAIGAVSNIPRGLQQYKFPSMLLVVQSVGSSLGAFIIVAFMSSSILSIIAWVVLLNWLIFIIACIYAWIILKPYAVRVYIHRAYIKKYFNFSLYSAISNLGGKIFTSGDRLLVGSFLGASAVTYYTVSIGIANKIFYFTGVLTQAIMPRVSELAALKNDNEIISIFRKSTRLISILSLGAGSILLITSKYLLNIWIGPEFAEKSISAFRWMVIIYALLGITPVAYFVTNGLGHPNIAALGAFGGGILMMVSMVPLSLIFQLSGAALANAGYLLSFIPVVYILKLFSKLTFKEIWDLFGSYLIIFTLFVLFSMFFNESIIYISVLSIVAIIIYGFFLWGEIKEKVGSLKKILFYVQGIAK